jgi:DeoR family ulaG and ulaABCDEF operon transcriptional repressor
VTVRELADLLEASEATIRRDLIRLESEGLLHRVRGGAQSVHRNASRRLVGQPQFDRSRAAHAEKKRVIGRVAADLCRPGDSIILAGGSTVFAMAEALPESGLDVLTNSFPIAEYLFRHTRQRVLLFGGELFREQGVILSPFEHDVSHGYRASKLFMGALGVTPHGPMESDPTLARAQQRLLEQTDEIILLVDSSKFASRGSLITCKLSRVSRVITDAGIPRAARAMLDAAGVAVTVAALKEARGSREKR